MDLALQIDQLKIDLENEIRLVDELKVRESLHGRYETFTSSKRLFT